MPPWSNRPGGDTAGAPTPEDLVREQAVEAVPQRRFLEPEEVAKLAVFLASDDAAGITGQTNGLWLYQNGVGRLVLDHIA